MRLKNHAGQSFIFDFIRKKWLVLTPEEWVRQHLLNFLVTQKNISPSRISIEKELTLNDLTRRYDIVVYDRQLQPWLIVECKAPYIALDNSVIAQALRYNLTLRSGLLMISNGISDVVFNSQNEICELPSMEQLNSQQIIP